MLDSANGGPLDQATGLRRLFRSRSGRAIAFVSGREACGRTSLLVQTAVALANAGESVLVIDENLGDSNVHAAFGLAKGRDLIEVASRDAAAESLVQPVRAGLGVLSAAKLATQGAELAADGAARIDVALKALLESASYVLVDCADRSTPLSPLAIATPGLAVVVAAQSSAITRAYALIKRLVHESGRDAFQIIVTRARSEEESRAIFRNMQQTAQAHLGVRLEYLAGARQPATDHVAGALEQRPSYGATMFRRLGGRAAVAAGNPAAATPGANTVRRHSLA